MGGSDSGQQGFTTPDWTPDPGLSSDRHLPLTLGGLRLWSQVNSCPQVLSPDIWAQRDRLFVGHPSLFPRDAGMGRVRQELEMPPH